MLNLFAKIDDKSWFAQDLPLAEQNLSIAYGGKFIHFVGSFLGMCFFNFRVLIFWEK